MFRDVKTMLWKERKAAAGQQQTLREKLTALLIPVANLVILAVIPPLSVGADWVDSPFSLVGSLLLPLMVVGMTISDSIAGERERRTLGTLLASRLPDQSILFGKMSKPVLTALSYTAVLHLVTLLVLNLAYWDGQILFYSWRILLANLVLAVLLSIFAAGLGVLISLRAATVQQATQNLMAALFAPIGGFSLIIVLIGTVFPESWRFQFERFFRQVIMQADFQQVILFIFAGLLVFDLVLILVAMARFQRTRMLVM